LVGVDDVRVIEPRGKTRLIEEHLDARRLLGTAAQPLDDDEPVEPGGSGGRAEIHVGHSASPERCKNAVPAGDELVACDGMQVERALAVTRCRVTTHVTILVANQSRINAQRDAHSTLHLRTPHRRPYSSSYRPPTRTRARP